MLCSGIRAVRISLLVRALLLVDLYLIDVAQIIYTLSIRINEPVPDFIKMWYHIAFSTRHETCWYALGCVVSITNLKTTTMNVSFSELILAELRKKDYIVCHGKKKKKKKKSGLCGLDIPVL